MNIIQGQKVVDFFRLYFKMPFLQATGIGFEENGYILGGVIFDNFMRDAYGNMQSCEAGIIVLDKKWVTRYNLKKIFDLPFSEQKIRRLQIRCGRKEKKKRQLIERMGFRYEGILRESWPFGGDSAVFSMLLSECHWLR